MFTCCIKTKILIKIYLYTLTLHWQLYSWLLRNKLDVCCARLHESTVEFLISADNHPVSQMCHCASFRLRPLEPFYFCVLPCVCAHRPAAPFGFVGRRRGVFLIARCITALWFKAPEGAGRRLAVPEKVKITTVLPLKDCCRTGTPPCSRSVTQRRAGRLPPPTSVLWCGGSSLFERMQVLLPGRYLVMLERETRGRLWLHRQLQNMGMLETVVRNRARGNRWWGCCAGEECVAMFTVMLSSTNVTAS